MTPSPVILDYARSPTPSLLCHLRRAATRALALLAVASLGTLVGLAISPAVLYRAEILFEIQLASGVNTAPQGSSTTSQELIDQEASAAIAVLQQPDLVARAFAARASSSGSAIHSPEEFASRLMVEHPKGSALVRARVADTDPNSALDLMRNLGASSSATLLARSAQVRLLSWSEPPVCRDLLVDRRKLYAAVGAATATLLSIAHLAFARHRRPR